MSPHAEWSLVNEIMPRINGAVRYAVNHFGPEDEEELMQDGVVMAAKILESAERRGKQFTPGNIAYFAIKHLKAGRRSYGCHAQDPHHPASQIQGKVRLASFEDPVKSDEEELTLSDVMTNDNEDPASKTARKLDWEAFLLTVDERAKVVLINLVEGRTMKEAARKLNCSISTINTMYRKLTLRILEFMGSDVLKDIQRLPSWKNNLLANRERLMCRDERRTT